MNSLLMKRVFINTVGEMMDMNIRENLCAEYDICNIWNDPQGFALKMEIGYFSYSPQSYQLHIYEDSEWAMGATLE